MSVSEYEGEFLAFLDATTRSTKRMADRAMVQFISLRLLLVLASALLPALTTLPDRIWSTAAAVLVAVLAGLDTQFQWGEEWRHFRSSQLALQRMRREYERRKSALDAGRSVGAVKTPAENFEKLATDVEELLQGEADRFFKFRITRWQSQERPS